MTEMNALTKTNIKPWVQAQIQKQAKLVEEIFELEGFSEQLISKVDGRGLRARGGLKDRRPYVKISEKETRLRLRRGVTKFSEYGSIRYDKTIGDYDDGTVEGAVICIIIHELAHAVDYWTMYDKGKKYYDDVNKKINTVKYSLDRRAAQKGGHGPRWKAIYALLRQKLVNTGYDITEIQKPETKEKKRMQTRKVQSTTLDTSAYKKREFFFDKSDRFSMIAVKLRGRQDWTTYLRDNENDSEVEMIDVEDGRRLRKVAEFMLEKTNSVAEKKAA